MNMKALINRFVNYMEHKIYVIKHRRPHIFDIAIGIFLYWAIAMLLSSCAVPIPLMVEVPAPEKPPIFAGEPNYI